MRTKGESKRSYNNFQRNRTESIFFSISIVFQGWWRDWGWGRGRKASRTTRFFGKRSAGPIIDSPASHSAVNQRHSCSFANLRKRSPSMNGRRCHPQLLPGLSSSSTRFYFFFSTLRIHFHFVDSRLYAASRIICREYKANWQVNTHVRAYHA